MTAEKCERAWDARSDLAGGGHYSVWPFTTAKDLGRTPGYGISNPHLGPFGDPKAQKLALYTGSKASGDPAE